MNNQTTHRWDVSITEARKIQERLAKRVHAQTTAALKSRLSDPDLMIGAADISYNRFSPILYACVLVMRLGDLQVLEQVGHRQQVKFPYVPGFLSFREAPVVLEAYRQLKHKPDLLLCDGQGLAHPRRLGLACHLGVLLDLPTIGCAKTRLIGTYREPGIRKGSATLLKDDNEVIGAVLRTRSNVKPVYVSVGHQICLDDAIRLVISSAPRYRIPEPLRQAHFAVNQIRAFLSR